jgi:pyruvate-formate lyase-activating enzyme
MKRPRSAAEPVKTSNEHVFERASYASQLCVIITEKCNIRCRHCISNSSPSCTEDLDLDVLRAFICEASQSEMVSSIGFSGGEPFLDTGRLERAVGFCTQYGLEATVTTNGFWASSVAAAKDLLIRLGGLSEVCLSTDAFHQEFVPVERIVNAIKACREHDICCTVLVTHLNDPLGEVARVRRQLRAVAGSYEMQQWPVLPSGRAVTEIDSGDFFRCDVSNAVCVSADTPTLNANAELTACCGPSGHWPDGHRLYLGRAGQHSLGAMLQAAENDAVIHGLRVFGPARMLALTVSNAREEGVSLSTPSTTAMCTICEYLFTDRRRTELVQQLLENSQTQRELAFGRMALLGEVSMFLHVAGRNDEAQ